MELFSDRVITWVTSLSNSFMTCRIHFLSLFGRKNGNLKVSSFKARGGDGTFFRQGRYMGHKSLK